MTTAKPFKSGRSQAVHLPRGAVDMAVGATPEAVDRGWKAVCRLWREMEEKRKP